MSQFEYLAVAAPTRGDKDRNAKTQAERYAVALSRAINDMAAQGWEYIRAETLPAEERSGLTGRTTVFHNLLVFRRPVTAATTRADHHDATSGSDFVAQSPQPTATDRPAMSAEAQDSSEAAPTTAPIFSRPMRLTPRDNVERGEPPLTGHRSNVSDTSSSDSDGGSGGD